eukprot:CAMPEP_0115469108 /NCGR_PEP_ID=MMETSP0271-20121206/51305_1 /TAXON_ID=71861 /ORGANISM="Scrippsiella trochoidea, Strain CCMP3099" /LENGTH=98 /DNA_ID=CAMNT_0002896187 /DNA_START=77 /DNA_END=370 /DNA_ORIENTATION=+
MSQYSSIGIEVVLSMCTSRPDFCASECLETGFFKRVFSAKQDGDLGASCCCSSLPAWPRPLYPAHMHISLETSGERTELRGILGGAEKAAGGGGASSR